MPNKKCSPLLSSSHTSVLLDELLPVSHFEEIHEILIEAPADRIFHDLRDITIGELPMLRLLFWVRLLPARLAGRRRFVLDESDTLFNWVLRSGFLLLAETPSQELVFGNVGRFWRLLGSHSPNICTAKEFLSFQYPGFVKVATNFRLCKTENPNRTWLITETRVHALDAKARRLFAIYWRIIQPGSALIRQEWLRAIKCRAEGCRGSDSQPRQNGSTASAPH